MFPVSKGPNPYGGGIVDICKVPAPPAPFVPTPFPNAPQYIKANQQVEVIAKELEQLKKDIKARQEREKTLQQQLDALKKDIANTENNLRAAARQIQAQQQQQQNKPKPPQVNLPKPPAPPGAPPMPQPRRPF